MADTTTSGVDPASLIGALLIIGVVAWTIWYARRKLLERSFKNHLRPGASRELHLQRSDGNSTVMSGLSLDENRMVQLRSRLAAGCPGCKAATGITEDTPLDRLKASMPKKCFYCGFDFENLT